MSDLDLPLTVRMMQDGYLMEIQDLKEKNEQLRRERDFYFQQVTENGERAHNAIDVLNAENEKLRELVRDMKAVIWAYDEYTSDDDCPPALPLFEDRLHELGIEVDE